MTTRETVERIILLSRLLDLLATVTIIDDDTGLRCSVDDPGDPFSAIPDLITGEIERLTASIEEAIG